MIIKPNDSVTFCLTAFYDWRKGEFLLSERGTYEVIVRCFIPVEEYGEVKVKEINARKIIIVKDYQGDDLNLWKRASFQTILSGQSLKDEQLRDLETLVTKYTKSPYRPYALAILGGAFGGISDKITIQQRIAYLEQLIKEYPQFVYIDYVIVVLCKLYSKVGQEDKIKAIIETIMKDQWISYTLRKDIDLLMQNLKIKQ